MFIIRNNTTVKFLVFTSLLIGVIFLVKGSLEKGLLEQEHLLRVQAAAT